jgi:hypothetical protein
LFTTDNNRTEDPITVIWFHILSFIYQ